MRRRCREYLERRHDRAPLSLCLLDVAASNSANNHQQTQPTKPAQLLIEKKQAEQRSNKRLDTRGNTRRRGIDSVHRAKEQEIRGNHGSDPQRRDVCPSREITRRLRCSPKQWQQDGEEYQAAEELPVQHLF